MQTIINVLLLGLVLILAVRLHKLERKTDNLGTNTGDAFAAVARHFQSIAKN